ncbi:hypothetical protein NPA08_04105 [Mycoplasmopsis citelli]|uniref:hypothetical protein n=1 Tax=Mycoplasmopsis citelli TaxID=171281 RepID=UPI0021152424|nr:hypothetical protein [Mycoplasmopsis citelli]UUD36107.1 hypothetical protein NPA08_04105 [Mycoplasmopsis citelli]
MFNGYTTGYFNIDFIDDENEKDFISTDRKNILWEHNEELAKLKNSLNNIVKKVAAYWRIQRQNKKENLLILDKDFFEGMNEQEIKLLEKIKKFLIYNSLHNYYDIDFIKELLEEIKTSLQFETFNNFINKLHDSEITVENILKITREWEYIEAKELSKVAIGRIKAIEKFEKFIENNESESKVIQPFLENFPWILDPRITTFEREVSFSKILKDQFPEKELEEKNKRIDFLCNLVNGELIIVELKRPQIKISLNEIKQCRSYARFLNKNHKNSFAKGIKTYLISDRYDMDEETKDFYSSLERDGKLIIKSYSDLLQQAKQYNKEFLLIYSKVKKAYKKSKQ